MITQELIGKKLMLARLEKGYTREKVAEISGFSLNTIKNSEKYFFPTIKTLIKLAPIYGVKIEWLVSDSDEVEINERVESLRKEKANLKRIREIVTNCQTWREAKQKLVEFLESDNEDFRQEKTQTVSESSAEKAPAKATEDPIGARFKKIRTEKKLSQDAMAIRIGVTPGAISNIETGKSKPSKKTLNRLKELWDVNPDWLLTGNGDVVVKKASKKEITSYHQNVLRGLRRKWGSSPTLLKKKLEELEFCTVEEAMEFFAELDKKENKK